MSKAQPKPIKLTRAHAERVLEVVDAGLCCGKGRPEPGHMCVEAAVCFALGLPHGDDPICVGAAVRGYKIVLNDAPWPSNAVRAEGLREIAVAQLGSNEIDQVEFAKRIAIRTVKVLLPIALRAVGAVIPAHQPALEAAATVCEAVVDVGTARSAASAAESAASAASAARSAAESAASAASAARSAARSAAWIAAESAASAASAARSAARSAAWSATSAAWSATSAAWSAAESAASAAESAETSVLKKAADIGVEVLKDMKCTGTKWLSLAKK